MLVGGASRSTASLRVTFVDAKSGDVLAYAFVNNLGKARQTVSEDGNRSESGAEEIAAARLMRVGKGLHFALSGKRKDHYENAKRPDPAPPAIFRRRL